MKFILALTLLLVGAVSLSAAVPAGKTQQLTSPDQVPQGLAKSDWSSIRAAYEAGRHAFQPVPGKDGIWQARNPGQQWLTTFDQHGFVAQPQGGGWTWGLELQSYGFGEKQTPISGQPTVKADGQRLSYQWDAAVQEWWVNDPRGLEHGFIIGQRPDGISDSQSQISDPLAFTLGVRGTLKPTLTADAKGLLFQDAAGTTVLNYTGLKVWDADGQVLPSRFEMSDSQPSTTNSQSTVRLLVDERTARYPITIDPIAQQAYLKASNSRESDFFGHSVAVSGDTVVVGAYGEASNATGVNGNQANNSSSYSGAAYVFTRIGGVWSQQAYLKSSNTGESDEFAAHVAVAGDTVVVGAVGEDSNATGMNGNQANNSASAAGAVYVFTRSGGVWSQQAYLKASNTEASDLFGLSVAVSGDTVVVGASGEDSNTAGVNGDQANNSADFSGAAYVFTRSGTVWSQQAYLKASNAGAGDRFGQSVVVSGDTVVVGAIGESSNTTGVNGDQTDNSADLSGAAYVFTRSGTVWTQQAYLKASNTEPGDFFGSSVAASGDTVAVGAHGEDSNATGLNGNQADNTSAYSGAAYVFTRNSGVWTQQAYLKASNTGEGDQFGVSVALSGDSMVVGAWGESSSAKGVNGTQVDNSSSGSGAAYAFTRSGGVWAQQAYLKASNTEVYDSLGYSVAVDGDTVVVGAYTEDSNATGVNAALSSGTGTQADNSAQYSGAVYTYTLTLPFLDPEIVTQPSTQHFVLGGSATFTITATGTGTLQYRWRRNTTNIPGATTASLKLTKLQANQQGYYDCVVTGSNGSVNSSPAALTLLFPVAITLQPSGGNYRAGTEINLSVQTSGAEPISFQWRKKGVLLVGSTDDHLPLTADANSAGDYDVIVNNDFSSVISALARVVVVDPPVITQQPTGLDVQPIDEARFSIEATGSGLTYQWRRNGVNIAIGKTATYYIANAQKAAHEGWYDCVVKNSSGIAISERVFLSVGDSLDVTVSTGDRSFVVGDTVDFVASVFSMSSDNPSYQWFRNGAAITGAKSYVLTLVNLDLTKVGVYSVLVTVGSLRATGSTLLTIADPGLLIYKLTGTSLDFKGVATDTSAFSGTLLVERYEGYSPAAMILTRKDGSYNVFEVQRRANFRASTTGLAPKAQTIFSEVSGEESTSQSLLWLQGAESLVTLSPTLKTLAPQTLKGSANSLFFNPNGGPTRTDAETVSLSAVLDAPNTTIARQKAETLEEAIERISLELLLKGYADQTVAP